MCAKQTINSNTEQSRYSDPEMSLSHSWLLLFIYQLISLLLSVGKKKLISHQNEESEKHRFASKAFPPDLIAADIIYIKTNKPNRILKR